jgi:glycosyltransferase involved in cell wall biosynthesis
MKLLIITQKIDKNDSILGFFHGWVEEFAKHFEKITVICLEKGEYQLPSNVSVYSLGKEEKRSRLQYTVNFYRLIWRLRNQYDSVFVHMNQEYVLLGGIFWKLLRKKTFLWRNHVKGNILTLVAVFFSNTVFATSPQSFVAHCKKTLLMPVGIIVPKAELVRNPLSRSVLFLGRLSTIKNTHLFIEALTILQQKRVRVVATINGSVGSPRDYEYVKKLEKSAASLVKANVLKFSEGLPLEESMKLFSSHVLYVNLTESGSLDKSIFGAMASGTPVLVGNSYFKDRLPDYCVLGSFDPEEIAQKIEYMLNMPEEELHQMSTDNYKYVKKEHSLERLAVLVTDQISKR